MTRPLMKIMASPIPHRQSGGGGGGNGLNPIRRINIIPKKAATANVEHMQSSAND